ncbi:MAG: DUF58 domain-containing protein [Oscillospiraceae bacterium]|nr:DUF58 domain-containing protein [Oscillospiraceae bacterium]
MMYLFIVCLFLLVFVLQRGGAEWSLSHLHYETECDTLLAEPEQVITLTSQIENQSLIPVLYVHVTESLPPATKLLEDQNWINTHTRHSKNEVNVKDVMYLLPHSRRTSKLHFVLPRRGWYQLGRTTVGTGDILGLRESFRMEKNSLELVVIPKRCELPSILHSLGGFLGDISVRRFILEDPILTIGFRDYTGSEPMKAISWSQSARTGRLQVKQYDYTVDANVCVILNTENGTEDEIEHCYSITRTVCEELESKGIPYEFHTNGDLTGPVDSIRWVAEGLGTQHLNTILYGLGRGNCSCVGTMEQLIHRAMHRTRSNQGYIVITPPLSDQNRWITERLHRDGSTLCILTGQEGAI